MKNRKPYTVNRIPIFLLLLFVLVSSGVVAADDEYDYIETQLIVRLEDDTNETIADVNADYGTTTIDVMYTPAAEVYLLQTPAGVDSEELAHILDPSGSGGDERIEYAEANYLGDLPEANPEDVWAWGGEDPEPMGEQYAPDLLNIPPVHQLGIWGAGVVVAVVDTGFQLDHPYLADSWTLNRYDVLDDDYDPSDVVNSADDDGDTQVDEAFGHGTHVAGIVKQVAPRARIMPIRALDSDGRSTLWHIGEAINFALTNGADVVNLSLGTDYESEMLEDLVGQAFSADTVIVAAAGNLNTNLEQFPAGFVHGIAVTSVDENRVRADSANYGYWVNIASPGVSIFSAFPPNAYAWWSGTSMATPFIAGEAALLLSLDPNQSAQDVITTIESTAVSIDAENPNYIGLLGAGLADVEAGVTSIMPPTAVQNVVASSTTNDFSTGKLYLAMIMLLLITGVQTIVYFTLSRSQR